MASVADTALNHHSLSWGISWQLVHRESQLSGSTGPPPPLLSLLITYVTPYQLPVWPVTWGFAGCVSSSVWRLHTGTGHLLTGQVCINKRDKGLGGYEPGGYGPVRPGEPRGPGDQEAEAWGQLGLMLMLGLVTGHKTFSHKTFGCMEFGCRTSVQRIFGHRTFGHSIFGHKT